MVSGECYNGWWSVIWKYSCLQELSVETEIVQNWLD